MYNFIDQKLLKNSTDRDVWPTHLVIICPLKIKQALRKFSETAKGWYWNMEKLYRKYAVKLYPMILVVNQYILLESSFEIMLSELKMSGKWHTFHLRLIYLKHSTEQKSHFIKLWYLKWKGVDRDRTLHLLGLNWEADFSWYSWSNTVLWLVS